MSAGAIDAGSNQDGAVAGLACRAYTVGKMRIAVALAGLALASVVAAADPPLVFDPS